MGKRRSLASHYTLTTAARHGACRMCDRQARVTVQTRRQRNRADFSDKHARPGITRSYRNSLFGIDCLPYIGL